MSLDPEVPNSNPTNNVCYEKSKKQKKLSSNPSNPPQNTHERNQLRKIASPPRNPRAPIADQFIFTLTHPGGETYHETTTYQIGFGTIGLMARYGKVNSSVCELEQHPNLKISTSFTAFRTKRRETEMGITMSLKTNKLLEC